MIRSSLLQNSRAMAHRMRLCASLGEEAPLDAAASAASTSGAVATASGAAPAQQALAPWPLLFTRFSAHLPSNASSSSSALDFRRQFTSRAAQIWEHLPSRKAQFDEAVKLAELLPHRASYAPQITAHGVLLMPKAVMQLPVQQQQQAAKGVAAASGNAAPPPPATPVAAKRSSSSKLHHWGAEEEQEEERLDDAGDEAGMHLATDRTKVWRRLKIKKHKIKKRRKANRYKST